MNNRCTSRNLEHFRAFAGVQELLGDRPLVLDLEFSNLQLMKSLVREGINWPIFVRRWYAYSIANVPRLRACRARAEHRSRPPSRQSPEYYS